LAEYQRLTEEGLDMSELQDEAWESLELLIDMEDEDKIEGLRKELKCLE